MQSATFNGDFQVEATTPNENTKFSFSGITNGVFQDSGNDVSFTLTDGVIRGDSASGGPFTVSLGASVTAFTPGDIYVRIDAFETVEGDPMFSDELLTNALSKWWRIPSNNVAPDDVAVTPDPSLLRAQAEVVRITEDKGVAMVEGRPAYHYGVAVDQEKLVAFLRTAAQEKNEPFDDLEIQKMLSSTTMEGELLIDAQTFFVRRLSWTIKRTGTEDSPGDLLIVFGMTVSNHNSAPEILPPENAEEFSPLMFLGVSGGLPSLDALPQMDSAQPDPFEQLEGLSQEEQQQLLLQMMEQGTMPLPVQ